MKRLFGARTLFALAVVMVATHGASCSRDDGAADDSLVDSTEAEESPREDLQLTGLVIAQADRFDYYGDYEVEEEDVLHADRLLQQARERFNASANTQIEEALAIVCEARQYWPNITRLYALEMLIEGPEDRMLPRFDVSAESFPGGEILSVANAILAGLEDEHLRLH